MSNHAREQKISQIYLQKLARFIEELVIELDTHLDKRLVRTLALTLQAILKFRHNTHGLLLSELGGYILSPRQAPARTKRISNLLRSTEVELADYCAVFMATGVPTWSDLLQSVLDELKYEIWVDELANDLSLPAIASLIEERLQDRKLFVDYIRNGLYQDFPFYPDGVDKSNRRQYVNYVRENNPTQLC